MKQQVLMSCKGWIQKLFPDKSENLAKLFSPSEAQAYLALPKPLPFVEDHLSKKILDAVHPTWIAPFLRTLSPSEVSLFLAALSTDQKETLTKTLGFSEDLPTLKPVAKKSLREILYAQVVYDFDLFPYVFLAESPFFFLLDLSEAKLKILIRYLGFHDLAFEMRKIISTQEIKKIFSYLTKKEGAYLNKLLLNHEPLMFERFFVNKWDGSKEQLNTMLNKQGICRLGHAVYHENESFIWYLTHKIDIHQGALLLKHKKKHAHKRGNQILNDQIESILKEVL